MNFLYSYTNKNIKKYSKLGVASLILCLISIIITFCIFSPSISTTSFDVLSILQLLCMFTSIVISINELYREEYKKTIPIISLTLMGILILFCSK